MSDPLVVISPFSSVSSLMATAMPSSGRSRPSVFM